MITEMQIVQLATLYGLGTRSRIRLNRDEFKKSMKQAFGANNNDKLSNTSSSSVLSETTSKDTIQGEGTSDFHGIVQFFESKQQVFLSLPFFL